MTDHSTTDRAPPPLPYTVPTSTRTLRLVAWASIVLAVGAALALVTGDAAEDDMAAIVGGLALFGVGGTWLLLKLKTFTSALVADEAGVTVHSQYGALGPIAWNEIRQFKLDSTSVAKVFTMKIIGVELQDPDRTMSRFGSRGKLHALGQAWTDMAAVGVPAMLVAAPTYEVLDNLNALLRQRAGRG